MAQLKWNLTLIKSNTYIDSSKEINDKNSKFNIGDNVRISKYKNVFAKGVTPNWSEEVFVVKKYIFGLLVNFMKTNCKKQIKNNLELKK